MQVFARVNEVRARSRKARAARQRLALVPTMGALHEGHLSLVRSARAQCDIVAASIFVNPTQFGPNEDFEKYPRSLERDRELLEREGVAWLFAPSVEEMYPTARMTQVNVDPLSERLCGKSRPGHFRGVATVVSKLFHIIEPDAAFFGQKDAAQVAIIRRMVHDLNLPVDIVACPIVREPDGLAMSSRNAYLSAEQRKSAPVLYRSLSQVKTLYQHGERSSAKLTHAATEILAAEALLRLDYFEIVDPETLAQIPTVLPGSLAAAAAFLGTTRLIDNVILA